MCVSPLSGCDAIRSRIRLMETGRSGTSVKLAPRAESCAEAVPGTPIPNTSATIGTIERSNRMRLWPAGAPLTLRGVARKCQAGDAGKMTA